MGKKKILLIHHCGLIGGAGISLYNVWKALKKQYDVVSYIPDDPPYLLNFLVSKGLYPNTFSFRLGKVTYYSGGNNIYNLKFWYHALHSFSQISYWKNVINKEQPDLVVVNSKVLCWMGRLLKKTKSLCFVRETIPGSPDNIMNIIMRYMLEDFTLVSFLSEYDLRQTGLKKAKSLVSPDFLEVENYKDKLGRYDASKQLSLNPECFNVLFVGGINRLKGIDLAVRALDYLKDEDVTLIVAGDDFDEDLGNGFKYWIRNIKRIKDIYFRNRIKVYIKNKGIENKIKFIGIQTDMSVSLSASDVLIFPMKEPHQARPAFEIGVQKKPVIITDFPNISEFIKNGYNGLTFERNNPQSLAKAILRLKNDTSLLSELGLRNHEYTMQYHIESYAMEILINKINDIL